MKEFRVLDLRLVDKSEIWQTQLDEAGAENFEWLETVRTDTGVRIVLQRNKPTNSPAAPGGPSYGRLPRPR